MPFNSEECKKFAENWSFNIITSSPLHSQSNGLAEKAVGVVKKMLKKSAASNSDFELFLLNHHNFPTRTLKQSPAELIFSKCLNTKIPIQEEELTPKLQKSVF